LAFVTRKIESVAMNRVEFNGKESSAKYR
jgi:hypothetical protein